MTSPSDSMLDPIRWFRDAAPYIYLHRGKTVVLMFGGEATLAAHFSYLVQDIILLHILGVKLVVVHGARPQIEKQLAQSDLRTPFLHHRRITTREALPAILHAVGAMRLQLEAAFSTGLAQSSLYGARLEVVSGNFVTAKPFGIHEGVDFQLTGEVRNVDASAICHHLSHDSLVMLGPTAASTTGEIFNLRAEEIATAIAIAIRADKLIFLGEKQGIYQSDGQFVRELTVSDAKHQLADLPVFGENALFLAGAIEACQAGVTRCHILSYREEGTLLQELFTRNGVGTLISATQFEDVRNASIKDVGGLLQLLRPLEQQGILVYRSRERLEQEIECFAVIERDGLIVACAALYPLMTLADEQTAGEIAAVAVHPDYRNANRGAQILNFLEDKARRLQLETLFLLTTRTGHWFMEQGFKQVEASALPHARLALYNNQRNSQIYCKSLVEPF